MNFITFNNTRYHLNGKMENWCSKQFGPGNWISERTVKDWTEMQVSWTIHSMFGNTTFSFKEPEDLTMFILRWS
jgi:hypothetical protein